MLAKRDIAEKILLKQYPNNEYWITAGAGLVLHGIKKETRDIDMGCTSYLADLLIKGGAEWRFLGDGTRQIRVDNDIEAFENWHADEVVMIDNLCVASLASIKKQKIKLNRPKDREDIVLIDKYLLLCKGDTIW